MSHTATSKYLSWVLRHSAVDQGLQVDNAGYVKLESIRNLDGHDYLDLSIDNVKKVVKTNRKNRFNLEQREDGWYIRANQGHSKKVSSLIDPDRLLHRVQSPSEVPVCVHGTYQKFWPSIEQSGLKSMSRQRIHCAAGRPKDRTVVSGARPDCNCFIYIDVKKAMDDGMVFWISSNGVILTEGFYGVIEPKYFERIEMK